MTQTANSAEQEPVNVGWRIWLALTLFIISVGWPLLVPVMSMLGVPGRNVAAFSGGMLVVAELLLIIAVAIAGKDGWKLITGYLLRAFSRFAPAEKVGRQRYRIGLAMFVVPLLTAWATPYVSGLLPLTQAQVLSIAVAGDVLLLASLFVLGGEFWDKLRSLFDYDMSAIKTEIVGVPADPPP